MTNVYVEAFNNQTFNQDGDVSASLRIKYYNPRNLIFQHFPVEEEVKNVEFIRMRNGYIIDTLTSVDIQEIVKNGGKVIEIYEAVIYRENFKISPFRKVIENLFALRQNYKDDHKDLMQSLVKLIMNICMEFRYAKTLINLKDVNHNIGWKQNTIKMCKIIGN